MQDFLMYVLIGGVGGAIIGGIVGAIFHLVNQRIQKNKMNH